MSIYKTVLVLTTFMLNCQTLQIKVKSYSASHITDWAAALIDDLKSELWSTDRDFIRIPDLQAETRNEVGKIPLQFEIFARRGFFGGLVSMERKNSVTVSTTEREVEIEFQVEIAKAAAHFDDCIVRCGPLKSLHELDVFVSTPDNTVITVGLTVRTSGQVCDVDLHQVRVEEFRNLNIRCDNYCVKGMRDMFHNWIRDYFNSHVCSALGSTITTALSKLLKKHNICMIVK